VGSQKWPISPAELQCRQAKALYVIEMFFREEGLFDFIYDEKNNLELPPIGWQLFIRGNSQSDSTPFPSLLDTYATRLLAEPLSRPGSP
jgi:hypothetical protein